MDHHRAVLDCGEARASVGDGLKLGISAMRSRQERTYTFGLSPAVAALGLGLLLTFVSLPSHSTPRTGPSAEDWAREDDLANIGLRLHEDMMYGTDDFFGEDTDLSYVDSLVPTLPVVPVTTVTPVTEPPTPTTTQPESSSSSSSRRSTRRTVEPTPEPPVEEPPPEEPPPV
jgi:hypothetical protein